MSSADGIGLDRRSQRELSPGARFALLAAGHLFVALGVIGAFLPLLPTTIFLIAAASCYARASTRFYDRLVSHRVFGPMILDWRAHRAMSAKSKAMAITSIVVIFALTLIFFLESAWARILHSALGLGLIGMILSFRTRRV